MSRGDARPHDLSPNALTQETLAGAGPADRLLGPVRRPVSGIALRSELAAIVGGDGVPVSPASAYRHDATEGRGLTGEPDAVVCPRSAEEVARVVGWCYDHDLAVIPRGGGTGFAGGAVPIDGGVVLSLERLNAVRSFDPLLWRISVQAGMRTSELHRRARENGLLFPPDPGAGEQSQIGGNIATNAGGPHAFKYGVTGAWVTGLEVVLAPGELVTLGGPIRKDVAGYDLKSLMIGSEGTLGVITGAWLRLIPTPEAALPVVAYYPSTETGCAAIEAVLGSGLQPATLEYLDHRTLQAAGARRRFPASTEARLMVIAEADGSTAEAGRLRGELIETLKDGALGVDAPTEPVQIAELWRWRDGVSIAASAQHGGKISEDIVVPIDRLAEAIDQTIAIGRHHHLDACSWGHAGDGNLHCTLLIDPDQPAELDRAQNAAEDIFALAARLGGSISGEHGIGWVKRGQLGRTWAQPALALHAAIKQACDPKGLINPGKKQG